MASLQELQEKRSKLGTEIRAMGDKFNAQGKKWTDAEQRSNWEKLNADYDANKSELDAAISEDSVSKRMSEVSEWENRSKNEKTGIPGQEDTRNQKPIGDERRDPQKDIEQRQDAIKGWMAAQLSCGLSPDVQKRYDEAMQAQGIRPWQNEIQLRTASPEARQEMAREWRNGSPAFARNRAESVFEKRAMSGTFYQSGGGLVFPTLIKHLEINMLAFGGMRQASTTITTDSGEETGMPTADDTSNEGTIIGENQSVGTDTTPNVGMIKWGAWTFSSKPVLVPFSLLQDSAFDIGAILGEMLGTRLGRATNRKYTVGNGVNEPKGIITAATAGPSSASSGAIGYTDIIKLEHSVDPAYRETASYMMHDTTLQAARLITDSQNRPLWTFGVQINSFDRFNNRQLYINQHMDAGTTTGNKSMLFGMLDKYIIRRAGVARMYRLQERYRDTDQDGFIMLLREDGNLLNAGTPPVKYLLQS